MALCLSIFRILESSCWVVSLQFIIIDQHDSNKSQTNDPQHSQKPFQVESATGSLMGSLSFRDGEVE